MRFIVGRFTSFSTEIESFPKIFLYSMKIKVQTRKLAAGCSKHCFEVVDRTDEVSSKHCFEVSDRTDEVSNHTYGKATLTWFEEIFEEY
ncbi:N-ethylammeline chlorohydrolase [Streptococcus pneumoniae]|nr:N-ethylammeline chlorohydrolase [Streptococcus pneumoniae]